MCEIDLDERKGATSSYHQQILSLMVCFGNTFIKRHTVMVLTPQLCNKMIILLDKFRPSNI